MKVKGKILSAIIAGAMAATAFTVVVPNVVSNTGNAVSVNAADSNTSGNWGDNQTWTLDSDGTLTISGSGDMEGMYWVYTFDTDDVKKIIVSEGVTNIESGVFKGFNYLKSVKLPDSITEIGSQAFYDCPKLESVNIPNGVTKIGASAFFRCKRLKNAVIPGSVKSIENEAFSLCSALTSVTIEDGVKTIGDSSFEECSAITSVTIPESVRSIGACAFAKCTKLTDVIIENSDCDIDGRAISNEFVDLADYFYGTIHGYEDSTAQEYAEANGYKFEVIEDNPVQTEPVVTTEATTTAKPAKTTTTTAVSTTKPEKTSKTTTESEKNASEASSEEAIAKMKELFVIDSIIAGFTEKDESDSIEVGNYTYYKVTDKDKISSIDEFQERINNTCTGDLRDKYIKLSTEHFVEKDGVLYGLSGGRGSIRFDLSLGVELSDVTETSFTATTNENNALLGKGAFKFVLEDNEWLIESYDIGVDEPTDPVDITPEPSADAGDANGDGKVNVRDAAFIAAKLAQGKSSELPANADFNGDGKVNVRDAAAIAKFLATGKK